MQAAMVSFPKPAPVIDRLPVERIDPEYKRLRRRVFIGHLHWLRRLLSGAEELLAGDAGHPPGVPTVLEGATWGSAMTGLSIAYGLSKFLMGSVSDRSNPRYFLPLGLLLSCGIMFLCGFVKAIYASLFLIVALQTLNGWFNGMGWAPCGKTMVHWFSTQERGRAVSVWNVAHNVGGALVATLARRSVAIFQDWGAKFYFNAHGLPPAHRRCIAVLSLHCGDTTRRAAVCLVGGGIQESTIRRTYTRAARAHFTFREIFLEHVLNNKLLWAIAMANAFVYFVRYGVVDWIPTYMQTAKGFSFEESSVAWAVL